MTTPIPVTIQGDWTWGMTTHTLNGPPDFVDLPVGIAWGPGAVGTHKLTKSVFHKGMKIAQRQHDQGPLIPHAPNCNPVVLLKSSRKIHFSVASVLLGGSEFGCIHGPNERGLVCGDVSGLACRNASNSVHSVFAGMTDFDRSVGMWRFVGVMASDATSLGVTIVMGPAGSVADGALDILGLDPVKSLSDARNSLIESVVLSAHSGWEKPVSIEVASGGPYLGGRYSLEWTPGTLDAQWKAGANLLGAQGEYESGTKRKSRLAGRWLDGAPAEVEWGTQL